MINFEVPPPSKRMRIVEDEGVEQLQPTALDSEETTTTGEAARNMCYGVHTHVQLYLHHIPTHVCIPLTTPNQLGVCGYMSMMFVCHLSHRKTE